MNAASNRTCLLAALSRVAKRTALACVICCSMASLTSGAVLPGIDMLERQGFAAVQGKRIGLITNHTGRSGDGRSSIDILYHAPGVNLVALYSPEHGIRGEADEKVPSGIDAKTGLSVHSLFGATCRPTPEMLRGIDMLVFDIQNIGTRFYTYIGTLSLAMKAAKKAGIPFVVLDRPNPINGIDIGGAIPKAPLPDTKDGCGCLTSIHRVPTRHGMTVGELARMFNGEFGIGCDLRVVAMQGWRRSMYFDETGLTWVNPSPNMKSLSGAILYPGSGTLETTNLSVGRGTSTPFELYGAPWLDAKALAANLEKRMIPGVRFTSTSFVPTGPGTPYRDTVCNGVNVAITDRKLARSVLTGLHLAQAVYEVHPDRFKIYGGYGIEVGDSEAAMLLTRGGKRPEEVVGRWTGDLAEFVRMREKYLLYGME